MTEMKQQQEQMPSGRGARGVRRSTSEYVKSPQQQLSQFVQQWDKQKFPRQTLDGKVDPNSAKAFFQKAEAQVFIELFRARVEQAQDAAAGADAIRQGGQ